MSLWDEYQAERKAQFQTMQQRMNQIMDAHPDLPAWDVAALIWDQLYDLKPQGPQDEIFLGQVAVVEKYRALQGTKP